MAYHADLPPIDEDELRADRRGKLILTSIYTGIVILFLAGSAAIVWWHP